MKKAIIVVAGGKGLRMGGEIPKQFLPVEGLPVLMRTLNRFYQYDSSIELILVLPESQQTYWKELCLTHNFTLNYQLANGGKTRFHSVKNGLAKVSDAELVGVHDGVRPFVSTAVINRCFEQAALKGAAIPVIDVVETVRQLTEQGSVTVPRDHYKLVQTPQVFQTDLLRHGYEQPFNEFFTDDASVVEALGKSIQLVEGNRENMKITTPFDLKLAALLAHAE
ncbi:MAG: 2-C-methyl-D-erythritol 4-phosphate cytidylyltransferase [Phocaeicola sp.]